MYQSRVQYTEIGETLILVTAELEVRSWSIDLSGSRIYRRFGLTINGPHRTIVNTFAEHRDSEDLASWLSMLCIGELFALMQPWIVRPWVLNFATSLSSIDC